jgi:hypothetical protein
VESSDQAAYRECSEPKTPEQATQDWEAFCEECYELRRKYRIADLYLVGQHAIVYPDGKGLVNGAAHFGDQTKREAIAAWALGFESAQRQARIAQIISDAATGIKNKRRP